MMFIGKKREKIDEHLIGVVRVFGRTVPYLITPDSIHDFHYGNMVVFSLDVCYTILGQSQSFIYSFEHLIISSMSCTLHAHTHRQHSTPAPSFPTFGQQILFASSSFGQHFTTPVKCCSCQCLSWPSY